MTRLDIERTELRSFAADVGASAARSLDLLINIEHTLTWLEHQTRIFQAHTGFAEKMNDQLDQIAGVIDANDKLAGAMEATQGLVEQVYQMLVAKRQAGRDDSRLTEDDGIEAAYTDAIVAAADLHNALNRLRWNVGEHDIDAVPHVSDPHMVASTPEEIERILNEIING